MSSLLHILAEGVTTVTSESRIELARWSAGNALLVGGALSALGMYAVWWLYRREGRGRMSPALRGSLSACRITVLMLLGLIGLEPVWVQYDHRRVDAQTLVLIDDSASMSLRDSYRAADDLHRVEKILSVNPAEGIQRREICRTILEGHEDSLLKRLAGNNDVRAFRFGENLHPEGMIPRGTAKMTPSEVVRTDSRPSGEAGSMTATQPEGSAMPVSAGATAEAAGTAGSVGSAGTDLGAAIRGALDASGGSPVAGIVILSDGGFNRGEPAAVLARMLGQQQIPVFVVGVGDPSEPVNARIVQITAPRSAFKNDPFRVTVNVDAEGIGESDIRVELFAVAESGARELAATRSVRRAATGAFPPVVFERKVEKPGTARFVARITPLPFESVTTDNERELSPGVRILDDQMKVLLIAGSPSYDYRFVARLFERDKTVDVSTWLESADARAVRDGNTIIRKLPSTPDELNQYDAIIMLDCDPADFDPTWGSMVSAYVSDYGGGLLYAAGNKFTGRFLKSDNVSSIVELLPIVRDPEAELVINELGHYQTRAWPILIPEESAGDSILRQSDDASQSAAIWSALGSIYWHYPVRREKPVARVLMRHSNPRMSNSFGQHALFCTQFVGTGRTAWLGINSTWRWRRFDEKHFNRFWIQALRFLVEGKLLGGRARGQIMTAKDEYAVGDTVVATVRALDERFNPLIVPELDMDVSLGTGESNGGLSPASKAMPIELTPVVGREGYYEGRFVATRVGPCRMSIQLPGSVGGAEHDADRAISHEVNVSQPDMETRNAEMHRAALQEFVALTGGASRYAEVDEAASIAGWTPDMSRTYTVRGRPRPMWDNAAVLGTLIGLLMVEWILRKKARLL